MVATAIYSVAMVWGKKPHFLLQSHGKALKKECRLPVVFCDSGDTPANLLCELNYYYYYWCSCCCWKIKHIDDSAAKFLETAD